MKEIFFLKHFLSLFILCSFAFVFFNLGLSNSTILDDAHVLKGISSFNHYPFFEALEKYSTSWVGSVKRPLSYLSYAIQYQDWPQHPQNFKLVNISIHIINIIFVYYLSYLLTSVFQIKQKIFFPLLVSSIWAFHPIQLSTVLYISQRMAELSTCFMLLGLIFYLKGVLSQNKLTQVFNLYIGFGVCLVLAVFSKENGILLCLYTLILNQFLQHKINCKTSFYTRWKQLYVFLPLIALLTYLSINVFPYLEGSYSYRDFSLEERLLTQGRVIFTYISLIIIPLTGRYTLFYDDYSVSTSLLEPISTIISLLAILSLLIIAFKIRKKYSLISLGLFLFFASHVLESTILPLELYFEHRNYFALVGIVLIIAYTFFYPFKNIKKQYYIKGIILSWCLLMLYNTYKEVLIWSAPQTQLTQWYALHTKSQRAHSHMGMWFAKNGQVLQAYHFYKKTIFHFPNDPSKPLLWLELSCINGKIPPPPEKYLAELAQKGKFYLETLRVIDDIIKSKEEGYCAAVNNKLIIDTLKLLEKNKLYYKKRLDIYLLLAKIYSLNNQLEQAIAYLKSALDINPKRIDILMSLSDYSYYNKQYKQSILYYRKVLHLCKKRNCIKYKNQLSTLKSHFNNE